MSKKINFQFLISYFGLIPYVLTFLDKYYFLIVEEEYLLSFITYYSLIIIVFIGSINWNLIGEHNKKNALATFIIAVSLGLKNKQISESLSAFKGTARRMEMIGEKNSISVYDDFAHHPTAIKYTLDGLRKKVGDQKIICLLEMRSNTMSSGYHDEAIPKSLEDADNVFLFSKNQNQIKKIAEKSKKFSTCSGTREFLNFLPEFNEPNTHIICLSNGSFDQIHHAILERL